MDQSYPSHITQTSTVMSKTTAVSVQSLPGSIEEDAPPPTLTHVISPKTRGPVLEHHAFTTTAERVSVARSHSSSNR